MPFDPPPSRVPPMRSSAARRLVPGALAALAVLPIALIAGCGAGDKPLSAVDPDAAPAHPRYEEVAAILDRNCVPCHHASGKAAPAARTEEDDDDDSNYDTCAGIQAGLDGIVRTAIDGATMPPGAWPRLDERERLLIRRWIDQGAASPCTVSP